MIKLKRKISPGVKVILSLEEKEAIRKKSNKLGLSMSSYLRTAGLKAK